MKRLLLPLLLILSALSSQLSTRALGAQGIKDLTLAGNTTNTSTQSNSAAHTFLTGATATFNSGSTLTVNGALAGTPTGGTLSLANLTLTLPTVPVSTGGTGATSLSANSVLLGNATSALQTVAPGTSGNVLTSNGTTWTSAAATGGVTSLTGTAGQITASSSTGAVTLSLPTSLTSINNITAASATNLTLTGGSTGASLALGQGPTNASATLTALGSSDLTFTAAAGSLTLNSARTSAQGATAILNNTSTNGPLYQWRKSSARVGDIGASGNYLGTTATDFLIGAQTNLVLYTNYSGTESARLTTTGNLLLGTTTDMSGSAGVKIAGTTASTSTTTGSLINAGGFGNAGALYNAGNLYVTSTTPLVGIGTTTPLAAIPFNQGGSGMEIKGTAATSLAISGTVPAIWFHRTNGSTNQKSFALASAANSLQLTSLNDAGSTTYSFFDASASNGALTLGGASTVVIVAGTLTTSSATLSGAGAIPITTSLVKFTSTGGAQALTLANGADGQRLTIVHDVDGGSGVLTPTTKTGFSTVTFTNAGDTVSLVYVTTRGWMVTGSYGVTIAP